MIWEPRDVSGYCWLSPALCLHNIPILEKYLFRFMDGFADDSTSLRLALLRPNLPLTTRRDLPVVYCSRSVSG